MSKEQIYINALEDHFNNRYKCFFDHDKFGYNPFLSLTFKDIIKNSKKVSFSFNMLWCYNKCINICSWCMHIKFVRSKLKNFATWIIISISIHILSRLSVTFNNPLFSYDLFNLDPNSLSLSLLIMILILNVIISQNVPDMNRLLLVPFSNSLKEDRLNILAENKIPFIWPMSSIWVFLFIILIICLIRLHKYVSFIKLFIFINYNVNKSIIYK